MEVIADPYGELPIKNDKYAASCTELHLGSRHITKLSNDFHKFSNLSILWLNNNHLTDINQLQFNIRLKQLYLHNNSMTTILNSALNQFKFLEVLTLNDNSLDSIEDVVAELKYLKHLKSLDLFNNPISQEDNYRLMIIGELPWLVILDRVQITNNEKKLAKKLKTKLKKLNNMKLLGGSPSHSHSHSDEDNDAHPSSSFSSNLFKTLLLRISQLFQLKRVNFYDTCLQYDPRRLGLISHEDFQACLIQFNIYSQLSSEEYRNLLNYYTQPTPVPSISLSNNPIQQLSKTTPGDGGVGGGVGGGVDVAKNDNHIKINKSSTYTMKGMRMITNMLNYRQFCQDTLPKTLQLTNPIVPSSRTATSTSTFLNSKTEKVSNISSTVKDLIQSVKKYQQEEKEKEEKKKRETLLTGSYNPSSSSSSSEMNGNSFTFYPSHTSTSTSLPGQVGSNSITGRGLLSSTNEGLDPWLIGQLRSMITEISLTILSSTAPTQGGGGAGGAPGGAVSTNKKHTLTSLASQTNPEIQWTSSHLEEIFARMGLLGKTTKHFTKEELIFQIFKNNKTKVPLKEVLQIFQLDSSSISSSHANTRPSSPTQKKLHFSSPKVEWRDLTMAERKFQENSEFHAAKGYLETILRGESNQKNNGSQNSASASSSSSQQNGSQGANEMKQKELFQLTFSKSINGTRMAASVGNRTRTSTGTGRATSGGTTSNSMRRSTSSNNERSEEEGEVGEEMFLTPERIIQSAPNRADVIIIPALKSAAIRQQQQDQLTQEYNWEEHFQKLGLKNERLAIAMRRKQRTLMSEFKLPDTNSAQHSQQPHTAVIMNDLEGTQRGEKIGRSLSHTSSQRHAQSSYQQLPPKKGWGSTTGTLVFK